MAKKFHSNSYDNTHFLKNELKAKEIGKIYNQILQDILRGFRIVDPKPNKFFNFDDYPQYKEKMQKLFEKFSLNITTEINKQSKEAWTYADKKNQDLLKNTMKRFGIKKLDLRDKYGKQNLEALRAFQNRKEKGMNLSERVWKQTQQYKKEIELSIDCGLRDGKSAAEMAREVKKYLQEPDRLFRKVRDNHGNLGLSKAAKAYHPGQGVYRSSVKNAQRLTRTENNMAYHESNFDKYNQFDFVIGIHIKLSNNSSHCPFCESMQGDYPKEFKFLGWHPHCRCTSVPILKSRTEMQKDDERIIQGLRPERSPNEVLNAPEAYNKYIDKNQIKLDSMPNKPYWYRDNIKLESKDKFIPEPEKKIKKVKTQEDKKYIQERWDARRKIHEDIRQEGEDMIKQYKDWGFSFQTAQPLNDYYDLRDLVDKNKLFEVKTKVSIMKDQLDLIKQNQIEKWTEFLPTHNNFLKDFDPLEIENAIKSARSKIQSWKDDISMSDAWFKKKLNFEIGYVESKKAYKTWEVSKQVYEKTLFLESYKPLVDQVSDQIEFLQIELKKNPTKKGSNFIKDLEALKEKALANSTISELEMYSEEVQQYIEIRKSKIKNPGSKVSDPKGIQYTQARRDAAFRTSDPQVIDDLYRKPLGEKWNKMDNQTKIALHEYTAGSGKFNRPLRGFDGGWFSHNFKGIGKVPLNNESSLLNYTQLANGKAEILDMNYGTKRMAKEIENHKLPQDLWLRRGDDDGGFNGLFKVDIMSIQNNPDELKKLIGKRSVDEGFLSTSPASESDLGFSGIIDYKIFAPKGTEAIYAEPFSFYGKGTQNKWDGKTTQKKYGSEFEMIVNQGYEYEILDINKDPYTGKINVIMQILTRDKRYKYF